MSNLPVGQEQHAPPGEDKVLGLMGVMPGTSPQVNSDPAQYVMTWPHLIMREITAFLLLTAGLVALSLFMNAPLEGVANPAVTPNPDKAPWYFVGLQELLSHLDPLLAGIIVPGILVLGLLLLPYWDRNPSTRLRERKAIAAVFTAVLLAAGVLTLIGQYFRGPNWTWTWPWPW